MQRFDEAKTTKARYAFTITRFQCYCVYRMSSDTTVFCPQHRVPIKQTETIPTETPGRPDIPGSVMHTANNQIHIMLHNSSNNSIHTMVSTNHGQGNEWEETQTEYVGICAACLIENDDQRQTRIAMCECGDEKCPYRWCGEITNLHAYWRLHVQIQCPDTVPRYHRHS